MHECKRTQVSSKFGGFLTSRNSLAVASLCLALQASSVESWAVGQFDTVALTGDSAPGGPPGAVFQEFGLAAINNYGSIAFLAAMEPGVAGVTEDTALGIWTHAEDNLTGVVVGDPPAPGIPGAVFESFFTAPQLSDSGAIVADFTLEVGPGGVTADTNDSGWLFTDGASELIYREGSSLPGFPVDAEIFFALTRMNSFGDIALLGRFRTGSGGVTAENDRGIWTSKKGVLNLLARSGDPALGAPGGAILQSIGINSFNDNGVVSSIAMLREGVGGVTDDNSEVVYSNRSGIYTLVYREGDVAIDSAVFESFNSLRANSHNRLAFEAYLRRNVGGVSLFNDRGIWVETESGLREVVRTDDPMPGVDGRDFRAFSNLVFNDAGRVAFAASFTTSVGFDSIFSEGISGELELVAREFDDAPGTEEGIKFDFDHIDFLGIPKLMMNNTGQVAFIAGLTGTGITDSNDFGLWAQNRDGVLQLIAREGDPIEVAAGDSRVVEQLRFGNMNQRGQIVFDTKFTDGSFAVLVSNSVATLPGDYNHDNVVDAADYTVWRDSLGMSGSNLAADGNNDGDITALDYDVWKSNFGDTAGAASISAVPEPTTFVLTACAVVFHGCRRRTESSHESCRARA